MPSVLEVTVICWISSKLKRSFSLKLAASSKKQSCTDIDSTQKGAHRYSLKLLYIHVHVGLMCLWYMYHYIHVVMQRNWTSRNLYMYILCQWWGRPSVWACIRAGHTWHIVQRTARIWWYHIHACTCTCNISLMILLQYLVFSGIRHLGVKVTLLHMHLLSSCKVGHASSS